MRDPTPAGPKRVYLLETRHSLPKLFAKGKLDE